MLYRGDIVEFVEEDGNLSYTQEERKAILGAIDPYRLIVLRPLGDDQYLVAICCETSDDADISFKTNAEDLHVKVKSFFSIDGGSLNLRRDHYLRVNKSQAVDAIYSKHNEFIELSRERQRQAKEQRIAKITARNEMKRKQAEDKRKKQNERRKKQSLDRQYKKRMQELKKQCEQEHRALYEMAVITNDKKLMQQIEDKLGCVPGYGTRTGKSGRRRNIYTVTNPRPYVGGRFSPK